MRHLIRSFPRSKRTVIVAKKNVRFFLSQFRLYLHSTNFLLFLDDVHSASNIVIERSRYKNIMKKKKEKQNTEEKRNT